MDLGWDFGEDYDLDDNDDGGIKQCAFFCRWAKCGESKHRSLLMGLTLRS